MNQNLWKKFRIYRIHFSLNVLAFWRIFSIQNIIFLELDSNIIFGYQTLFLGMLEFMLHHFWRFCTLMSEIFETLFSQLRSRRPVETPFVKLFLWNKEQKVQRNWVLRWQIWGNVHSFVFMLKDRLFWIVINVSSFKWKLLSVDGLWGQHQFR